MGKIVVLGLGPAGPDLITERARTLLAGPDVVLRTRHHPAASLVPAAETFDDVYDAAERIEDVYPTIVERLVARAASVDELVYAVPGSPLVAEATVDLLRADPRVEVEIEPAMSFLDLVWARLGVDPLAVGPRFVDGRRFAVEAAGERGPLLVAQCDAPWVLSEVKLAFEEDPPAEVVVLQRLGLPDEVVRTIAWEDLDRVIEPDHLTSLWIPEVAAPVALELARVDEVARRLRRDCPWDREQTHGSLARYLIEESYELLDAIEDQSAAEDEDEADIELIEELGDLLFQVFAHSAIATEEGRFGIADVARTVADKLIERHPHVYGEVEANTADAVAASWEANKTASKGRASIMEGIPRQLPALLYAAKVLHKASVVGVELDDADVADRGIGGALMLVAQEARARDEDPETALRSVVEAFRERVEAIERDRP